MPMVELHKLCVQDELAANVTLEQGKTLPDAKGDVFRGLGTLPGTVTLIFWHFHIHEHHLLH